MKKRITMIGWIIILFGICGWDSQADPALFLSLNCDIIAVV